MGCKKKKEPREGNKKKKMKLKYDALVKRRKREERINYNVMESEETSICRRL